MHRQMTRCCSVTGWLRASVAVCLVRTVIIWVSAPPLAVASVNQSEVAVRTQANVMIEIAFTATRDYGDAFGEVTLNVVFEAPRGRTLKVPAFWAGGRVWKVRYASPDVGIHRWQSVCSVTADRGLQGLSGQVTVEPYRGENPLYLRGPVRVAADRRHFEHLDGTPFFWLGDTWWMGLCQRLHWPQEFEQLAADRKAKGFTVIQIVAGLYPDMPAFDPRGANEAGFPWEREYSRIRPEYFDRADQRLLHLVEQGLVPCVVGAWGYHLPWMGTDRMKEHWRYLIARYGALPVVWCAAGEGTMPFYGSKEAKKEAAFQREGWTEVIRYIRATDPFGRMVTIHPSRSARETVTDPSLLDFDMHQTGHRPEDGIGPVARQMREAYEAQPTMPVIAGESSYDGLDLREWGGGVLSSDAARQMFWVGLMHNGAAGGTYGANGIWQVNRREEPYGPSPHGRSWGSTPWDEAMGRAGSVQVGLAKQFFAQYPWHRLEPKPDTIAWDDSQPTKNDIRPGAVGMGTDLRIAYVPRPRPVVVKELVPQGDYVADLFDPVTGRQASLGTIRTDASGSWHCPAPDHQHDWVVVLVHGSPGDKRSNERWTAERASAWYQRQPWLVGFNYVPSTASNTTEWWQGETFDPETIDRELGWAEDIGFNSARCFIQYLVWKDDPEGFKRRFERFLAIAKKHGITVMPVLFDDCTFGQPPQMDPYLGKQREPIPGMILPSWTPSPGRKRGLDPQERPSLERYVQDMISTFRDDRRIIVWDLYNEPMNRAGVGTPELLREVFSWAKGAKPSQPITIGVWNSNAAINEVMLAESDVISFHLYGPLEQLKHRIGEIKQHGRPVICTEWMARARGSRFDTDLPVFRRQHVGCYQWGLVNGRTQAQFPWWNRPGGQVDPNVGWFHDILHKDGTPYRPGEIEAIRRIIAGEE